MQGFRVPAYYFEVEGCRAPAYCAWGGHNNPTSQVRPIWWSGVWKDGRGDHKARREGGQQKCGKGDENVTFLPAGVSAIGGVSRMWTSGVLLPRSCNSKRSSAARTLMAFSSTPTGTGYIFATRATEVRVPRARRNASTLSHPASERQNIAERNTQTKEARPERNTQTKEAKETL